MCKSHGQHTHSHSHNGSQENNSQKEHEGHAHEHAQKSCCQGQETQKEQKEHAHDQTQKDCCKGNNTQEEHEGHEKHEGHSHDHAQKGCCKGSDVKKEHKEHAHDHSQKSCCKGPDTKKGHAHYHAHEHSHKGCSPQKACGTQKEHKEHAHNHSHGHSHKGCKGHHSPTKTSATVVASGTSKGSPSDTSNKLVFKIDGMCCASEIDILKDVLAPVIQDKALLSFDLINAKLIIESKLDNFLPSKEDVSKAVARSGMTATLWAEHVTQDKNKTFWQRYGHIVMNVISLITFLVAFINHLVTRGASETFGGGLDSGEHTERPPEPPVVTMVFYSISIVTASWFIFPKAILAILRLKPNTKLLMVLATGGAIGLNKWFEAAISMYLFSAAEFLEAWNMERARKSIRALMELAPSFANVVNEDGSISEQPVEQIAVGTIITIKPGEKIPMDSVLLSGFTSVNQAPITGESLPVSKEAGDSLFAGTINGDNAIQCEVTKAASDSTLASIIRKIEEAQSKRAQTDQWIEKFSIYYVPAMIIISILVCIIPPLTGEKWYPWIYKGIELLVISCPCSLVISTPVSIVAGITAAARSGVLIKGGIHLENAAHLKAFAMDKTGTITTGEPVVHNVIPLNGLTREEVLTLAAALEVHSDHPLARAIQYKAKAEGITYQPADEFQVFKGKGAEGMIKDQLYWIGSHRFLHEKVGENEPAEIHTRLQELETEGHSIISIGHGHQIIGLISVADAIRPESKEAIQAMKKAGIKRVAMLTGDNKGAARVIAETVKIDEYHAELLPEDKVKKVEELVAKYKNVAMVGDGINDAPAMAASSLAIAMGTAGSDTAIETADIALMSDDLGKLAWLVKHSRRTINIIIQNVVFSLATKAIFVVLVFINKSSLWLAIAADLGTTFIVITNALRLVSIKKSEGIQRNQAPQLLVAKPAETIEIVVSPGLEPQLKKRTSSQETNSDC